MRAFFGLVIIGLALGLAAGALLSLPKAGTVRAHRPSALPASPEATRYKRALARYQQRIAAVLADRRSRAAAFRQDQERALERSAEALAKSETDTLAKLRILADKDGGELRFDGGGLDYIATQPSSAASARILAALVREGRAKPERFMRQLLDPSQGLDPAWFPLLQEIAAGTPGEPALMARALLYSAGVSAGKHRAALVKGAEQGIPWALEALLYQPRRAAGAERLLIRSAETMALATRLSRLDPPETRLVCADFLASVGKPDQAQSICAALLTAPNFNAPGPGRWRDSSALVRARTGALCVLFFKVRTPEAYRIVYERGHLREAYSDDPSLSNDWKRFVRSDCGQLEIDVASSLLEEVDGQN